MASAEPDCDISKDYQENEIKVDAHFVYIVVCWRYGILRDYLKKKGFQDHMIPNDFTEEQIQAEIKKIMAFYKPLGVIPTLIDMGNLPRRQAKEDIAFKRIEDIFHKDLIE